MCEDKNVFSELLTSPIDSDVANITSFFLVKLMDMLSSEEYRKHRREMNSMGTDESKRRTDVFNEQYMGMPGTFRTLSVD